MKPIYGTFLSDPKGTYKIKKMAHYFYFLDAVPEYFNGTSQQNCRFKNKSVMIAQDDVFATWVYKFQELNTIPNSPEKFRKQVIKTFSIRRLVVYRNQM